MAVLTFSSGRQILDPFLLNVMQIHVLIRDLIHVLHSLEDRRDGWSSVTTSDEVHPPIIPTPPPRQGNFRAVRPSRRPSSPTTPIGAHEVRQLQSLLKNVKHHDDFQKFIGSDPLAKEIARPVAKKKQKAPQSLGRDQAEEDRQRRRRLRSRSKRRNLRKEK